jgi:chemotaxis protein MotB
MSRKRATHGANDAAWLLTYADMITLLMALFLLLFSMSDINPAKFEETTANISEQMTGTKADMPIHDVIKRMKEAIKEKKLENSVKISTDGGGIVIEFQSGLLFAIGEDKLQEGAYPILNELIHIMSDKIYLRYGIEVEGHTDDIPIQSERFPSNWELSSARATSVTKLFADNKFDIRRLRAVGYGESQPIAPNRDASGNLIAENQAKNRRVVVRMYPQTFRTLPEHLKKEALEKAKKKE